MKYLSRLPILVFLGSTFAPFFGLLFLFLSDHEIIKPGNIFYSKPNSRLSVNILDNNFQNTTDRFINREAIFRDYYLNAYSYIKFRIFGVSPTDKVLIGRHGWLFYKGGKVLDDYQRRTLVTDQQLHNWTYIRQWRKRWLNGKGVKYLLVLVPNKYTIYPEHAPTTINFRNTSTRFDQLVKYISKNSNLDYIDLRGPLILAKKSITTHYISDSHWNSWGAYIGYKEIIKYLKHWYPNLQSINLSTKDFRHSATKGGDLARMMRQSNYIITPVVFPVFQPEKLAHSRCDVKNRNYIKSPWPIVDIDKPFSVSCRKNGLNLLAFHDSMFNHLSPFILQNVGNYYDVRTWPSLNELQWYVNNFNPDVVIEQITERDVFRLPSHDLSIIRDQRSAAKPFFFNSLKFNTHPHSDEICNIDNIQGLAYPHNKPTISVVHDTPLTVFGWSAHKSGFINADNVFLELSTGDSKRSLAVRGIHGISRLDVAKFYKHPNLANSGFKATIDIRSLKKGIYTIHVWNKINNELYKCKSAASLAIN